MYIILFLQVLSGDAVVIRNQPRSGPPQEKILAMSNVIAPRLARRPNLSADASTSGETKDEVRFTNEKKKQKKERGKYTHKKEFAMQEFVEGEIIILWI